ncbi:hypothetical protein JCM3774_000470 [Rhodotorula dairenensis]
MSSDMPSGTTHAAPPTPARRRVRVGSFRPTVGGTTLLAALVAALAVVLYSRSSGSEAVPDRLRSLLGKRGVQELGGRTIAGHSEDGAFPALAPLADRKRLWPPAIDQPICTPKIYVYDLPPELRLPEQTASQCRWSAYNSELLLHRLLTEKPPADPTSTSDAAADHPQSNLRTVDPAEADFFFVPLFPACYLFDCWVKAGWNKTERCNVDEGYIQPVMQHLRQAHPYWNASGGSDHLLVHPMDYVDGYYTEETRASMNSSTYLVTVGDVRPAPYGSYFRSYRDVVIPSSTHLINSYHVNPRDFVDADGHPLPEPRGAADPRRRLADSALPYPEIFEPSPTDVGLSTRIARFFGSLFRRGRREGTPERTMLAIFRGGWGEATDGEAYALGIRSLFFPSDGDPTTPPFSAAHHHGFASLPDFDIALWSENDDYADRLAHSKFGLAPPGYTLDTTRLYEYLAFGVVPVFIGTGPTAGQVLPFERDIDWHGLSLSIPRERAHEVPTILRSIGADEYERRRRKVWDEGRRVVLEGRQGTVWKLIARQLCRLKRLGVAAGPEIANN